MMNTRTMNDEMLRKVTGGDNGDAIQDCNENYSRYSVGETVLVYLTGIHFFCKICVITNKRFSAEVKGNKVECCWRYKVHDTQLFGNDEWVTADDIAS